MGALHCILPAAERTAAEIDREIRDEFDLHLALAERDLVRSGVPPAEARSASLERFGDIGAAQRACRVIALQERVMMQRINFVLLIVIAFVLGFGVLRLGAAQSSTARSVADLVARLDSAGARVSVGAPVRSPVGAPPASSETTCFIDGDVSRPGTYALAPGLTLRRALIAAGGVADSARTITIRGSDGSIRLELETAELGDPAGRDAPLQAGDMIQVD